MKLTKIFSTKEIIDNSEVSFVNSNATYYVYYDKPNADLCGSLIIGNDIKEDDISSYIKSLITQMQCFAIKKKIITRGGKLSFTTNGTAISINLVSDVINPEYELNKTIEANNKKENSPTLKFNYKGFDMSTFQGNPKYKFPVDRIYIYRNIYTDKFTMSIQLDESSMFFI